MIKVDAYIQNDLVQLKLSHDAPENLNKFEMFLNKKEIQNLIYDLEEILEDDAWGPSMEHASDFDLTCQFSKEEMLSMMEDGIIEPYDGDGYWGTGDKVSDVDVFKEPPEWATHGYWFNR